MRYRQNTKTTPLQVQIGNKIVWQKQKLCCCRLHTVYVCILYIVSFYWFFWIFSPFMFSRASCGVFISLYRATRHHLIAISSLQKLLCMLRAVSTRDKDPQSLYTSVHARHTICIWHNNGRNGQPTIQIKTPHLSLRITLKNLYTHPHSNGATITITTEQQRAIIKSTSKFQIYEPVPAIHFPVVFVQWRRLNTDVWN